MVDTDPILGIIVDVYRDFIDRMLRHHHHSASSSSYHYRPMYCLLLVTCSSLDWDGSLDEGKEVEERR